LATLYLTERCNSRCVTCDYWRHGRGDMTLETVRRLLPSLAQLQTQTVLLSGGEPLLNPEWIEIARTLKDAGLSIWLLTSGLSLAKHAPVAAGLFDRISVSMDGTDAQTYAAIRGLDAFDKVCEGIGAAVNYGLAPGLRVTLQRANYRQLIGFVELARRLGAAHVSFLAVDVANPHAFGRKEGFSAEAALDLEDVAVFDELLLSLQQSHAADFASGFIAESPAKLERIAQYFAAVQGAADYPAVRCNAPEFSAVIGATGRIQPCFFIPGPPEAQLADNLPRVLNSGPFGKLRADIRAGMRRECKTCVCSLWRNLDTLGDAAVPAKFVL
jgi:MoaA/NifB/PqqE/SkfB family radical SAM enzyme